MMGSRQEKGNPLEVELERVKSKLHDRHTQPVVAKNHVGITEKECPSPKLSWVKEASYTPQGGLSVVSRA
jgi:hypothetical protein